MNPYRTSLGRPLVILLLTLVVLIAGCSKDDLPLSPGIEPEIVNSTDNFQFQVTAMLNYTGTLNYTWTNTGTEADVDQSTTLASGSAVLKLFDHTGTQVYSRSLTEDGSFASTAGTAGSWAVRVEFQEASGTVNFRADKRTP